MLRRSKHTRYGSSKQTGNNSVAFLVTQPGMPLYSFNKTIDPHIGDQFFLLNEYNHLGLHSYLTRARVIDIDFVLMCQFVHGAN